LLVSDFTEETIQAIIRFRTAFPDGHVTIEEMVAEGDTVMARWTFRGTHQSGFQGGPPVGTPVMVPGLSIDRITDGKIAHSTNWTGLLSAAHAKRTDCRGSAGSLIAFFAAPGLVVSPPASRG